MNKLKLKLKAYKIAWPDVFDYEGDFWNDKDQYGVIYGKNQKQAVNNYCLNVADEPYYEVKKHARTRRFKDADLYSQEPSTTLETLNSKEIDHLLHSLGVEIGECYNGDFYRDYSVYYSDNEDYKRLIELGLVKVYPKFESYVYKVTEKGKEAVKTLLLIKKPTKQ